MHPRDPNDIAALRAASDVLAIDAKLSEGERAVRDRVRAFVDERDPPPYRRLVRSGALSQRAGALPSASWACSA